MGARVSTGAERMQTLCVVRCSPACVTEAFERFLLQTRTSEDVVQTTYGNVSLLRGPSETLPRTGVGNLGNSELGSPLNSTWVLNPANKHPRNNKSRTAVPRYLLCNLAPVSVLFNSRE